MGFGIGQGWGGEEGRDVVSDAYVGQWRTCILFRRPRDLLIRRCERWVLNHLSFCLRVALADVSTEEGFHEPNNTGGSGSVGEMERGTVESAERGVGSTRTGGELGQFTTYETVWRAAVAWERRQRWAFVRPGRTDSLPRRPDGIHD